MICCYACGIKLRRFALFRQQSPPAIVAHALLKCPIMEKSTQQGLKQQTIAQMKGCAMAILFLRLFIGGVMLLHIIGKMQTYDNLVLEYPPILGLSRATSLSISMIVQGCFAALLMIGIATRFVSLAMVVLTLLSIVQMWLEQGMVIDDLKVDFLYLGIYTTLLISGSGSYGFNVPWLKDKTILK